jgi:hypothetical protein
MLFWEDTWEFKDGKELEGFKQIGAVQFEETDVLGTYKHGFGTKLDHDQFRCVPL